MVRNVTLLKRHTKRLARATIPMSCPYCQDSLLPKEFETHCTEKHTLDPKTECVWCKGKVSWPRGKKTEHARHLLKCSARFIASSLTCQSIRKLCLFSRKHPYPERVLLGGYTLPSNVKRYDFEDEFLHPEQEFLDLAAPEYSGIVSPLTDIEPTPLPFQDESVNLAISYLKHYEKTRDTHDWLHVILRAVTMESFVTALKHDPCVRMLEFACWCNGGKLTLDAKYTVHRHAVLTAPKGHLPKKFWPRVDAKDKPSTTTSFNCKTYRAIQSAQHLINTLNYLSNRKSQCSFSIDPVRGPTRLHHFHLYRTLPAYNKIALSMHYPKGLEKLLYHEMFKNVSIPEICQHPLTYDGTRYLQLIKHFYKYVTGQVLPVARNFVATRTPTPLFLHLLNDLKLYFRPLTPEEMQDLQQDVQDDQVWLTLQAEGGNCFLDCIGDEHWNIKPSYQAILHYHKPVLDRCNELQVSVATLKSTCETQQEKINSQQEKIENLLGDLKRLHEKVIKNLETRVQNLCTVVQKLTTENARLKEENVGNARLQQGNE